MLVNVVRIGYHRGEREDTDEDREEEVDMGLVALCFGYVTRLCNVHVILTTEPQSPAYTAQSQKISFIPRLVQVSSDPRTRKRLLRCLLGLLQLPWVPLFALPRHVACPSALCPSP